MNAFAELAIELIIRMISGFFEDMCLFGSAFDKKSAVNSIDLTAIDWRKEKPL